MEVSSCKYCNRALWERDIDEDGLCKIDCGRKQEARAALGIGKTKVQKPEKKEERERPKV